MEPILEQEFEPQSDGFRPERGCKEAPREVDQRLKAGYTVVVDADMASYFDSIPRYPLLARLEEQASDGTVPKLVEAFLRQDVLDGLERWTSTGGTPQGAVLGPLLANVYLHPRDREMTEAGYRMVRYADEFVVLCRTPDEAQAALARV